uniref:Uncharacterized protein n=1 Tax=Romanomermis culicivorax TaxID=13658 RepID=A0A915IGA9_ROMCU
MDKNKYAWKRDDELVVKAHHRGLCVPPDELASVRRAVFNCILLFAHTYFTGDYGRHTKKPSMMIISGTEYSSWQNEGVINVEKIVSNSGGNNNNNSRSVGISMVAQERPLIDGKQCGPLIDQAKWELGQLFRRPTLPMVQDHSESTTLDDGDEEGKLTETAWSKSRSCHSLAAQKPGKGTKI